MEVTKRRYFIFELKRSLTSLPSLIFYAYIILMITFNLIERITDPIGGSSTALTDLYNFISSNDAIIQLIYVLPPVVVSLYYFNYDFFRGVEFNLTYHFGIKYNESFSIKLFAYIITLILPAIAFTYFSNVILNGNYLVVPLVREMLLFNLLFTFTSVIFFIIISIIISIYIKANMAAIGALLNIIIYGALPFILLSIAIRNFHNLILLKYLVILFPFVVYDYLNAYEFYVEIYHVSFFESKFFSLIPYFIGNIILVILLYFLFFTISRKIEVIRR
ncbi:hypothetical protein SJAV_21350 [Sulfurisphaera javensis]|uniref:ABC transporter permease n=1 Tax=Sulfurisphaera javensis TaxID=2049879 RepID=A0AAT9GTU5_9CREN